MTAAPLTSRNWFGKAAAGVVLGFAIALGLSGLTAWALGVGDTFFSTKGQFTMWMIGIVWPLILSFVFLFRDGVRAWGWLGLVAAMVWAALWMTGRLG